MDTGPACSLKRGSGDQGLQGQAQRPAPPGSHRRPWSGPHRSESLRVRVWQPPGGPAGLKEAQETAATEAARAPLPGRVPRLLLSWLGSSGGVTQPLSFLIGEMRIKAAPNSPG